jgi:F-type H+-transporting ATPase subunit b
MSRPNNFLKLFRTVSAAVLVFVLVAGLGRAVAQDTKPAASAEKSAVSTQNQPEGEAAKPSQEEQEHGFLVNGAVVKWLSGVTGWSRDTTSQVFLWFNFAIVFFGVAIPVGRKLPQIFRKRAQTLSHSLEEARKATADANARLSAVEARLAGLDQEIGKFRTQVEEDSKADEQRIKSSMEEEKTRIVASAEQELNVATAQAKRNLRNFATDLAIEQATAQLKLTPEADRALIAEFVANAGNGGKN